MGIGDIVKTVSNKLTEARDRAQEQDLAARNQREMEASAERIEYEKKIREKQLQAKITPEMAEQRRKENAMRYEHNIKSTGEKAKEAIGKVIAPAAQIRERNIQRMERQPVVTHQLKRQPAMQSGQFHAPSFGSGMNKIDPFAGLGGGGGGMGFGGRKKKKGGGGRGGFMDPFNF